MDIKRKEESWCLIDHRANLRQRRFLCCRGGRQLKQRINALLKTDRAAQTKRTGKATDAALLTGDIREAFRFLQGWYRDVMNVVPKPCF